MHWHVCNLLEDAGISVEAGVRLQYEKDNVRGPAYESQNYAAAQEKPVVGVVVDQTFQRVGDQGMTQRDLTGGQRTVEWF